MAVPEAVGGFYSVASQIVWCKFALCQDFITLITSVCLAWTLSFSCLHDSTNKIRLKTLKYIRYKKY